LDQADDAMTFELDEPQPSELLLTPASRSVSARSL
jgi:hypothetical protein